MNEEYCIVTDSGFVYTSYDEWIKKNFPGFIDNFKDNHDIEDIKPHRLYKVIGHAPHGGQLGDTELYLIQDTDTKQVFIVEEEGIVMTTTVTVTKNTNTIYCDDSLDATRYTYNIRGGERNMDNRIVDLYYERKREEIRNKYTELVDEKYEQLNVVKEYKELVNTFVASLAEMADRYNTEETKMLLKTGYMGEYTYDLSPELRDNLREAYKEDFNKEMKDLELLIEEVRAMLSFSDNEEHRMDVLKKYEIVDKKGKLNV